MGYDDVWKVLADLITEFRKRGETIPHDVMEDLRAAKTMIQVLRADPNRKENLPSIELHLGNVESYLIFQAQKKFGSKFVDEWMQKIKEARQSKAESEQLPSASKFAPGLPRGQKWVRVQITEGTPEKEIRKVAEDTGLSCRTQSDDFLLVYGEEEKLKLFVKKAQEKFSREKA
jgi:hypothetical protein